jgi:hypothetical protein
VSDWGDERLRDQKGWKCGVPPTGNANFAWVQHIICHLAPAGVTGFVLANGSISPNQSGEGEMTDPPHLLELFEAYWGTVSLPFETGEHKRIAVKIVDDRGIESLKVLELSE